MAAPASVPEVKKDWPRTWSTAGLLLVVLVATLLSGCSGADADRWTVSRRLRAEAPSLAHGFRDVRDLRQLTEPSAVAREFFERQSMVYRVIEASPDSAVLAVWIRAAPAAEPFNRNRTAVGSTCVSVVRTAEDVVTQAIACPHRLADDLPAWEAAYWGRDAESRAAVDSVREDLSFALWWALARNADGTQPRTESRNADDLAAVIDQVGRDRRGGPEPATIEVIDLVEQAGAARGRVRVGATARDLTRVGATTVATGCFDVEVDLTARPADRQTWYAVRPAPC